MGVLRTTPQELETVAWLYTECDWTLHQISRAYGRSQNWATRRIQAYNEAHPEDPVAIRKPSDWIHRSRLAHSEDDAEIIRLYVEERLTMGAVGSRLHWSKNFIRRRLLANGIKPRPRMSQGRKVPPPPAIITRIMDLFDMGYSVPEIAREVHWSESFVRDRLKENGVKLKRVGGRERIPETEALMVKRLYVDEDMDMQEVAQRLGKTNAWVRNRLFKAGVELRSKSEVLHRHYARRRNRAAANPSASPSPRRSP